MQRGGPTGCHGRSHGGPGSGRPVPGPGMPWEAGDPSVSETERPSPAGEAVASETFPGTGWGRGGAGMPFGGGEANGIANVLI